MLEKLLFSRPALLYTCGSRACFVPQAMGLLKAACAHPAHAHACHMLCSRAHHAWPLSPCLRHPVLVRALQLSLNLLCRASAPCHAGWHGAGGPCAGGGRPCTRILLQENRSVHELEFGMPCIAWNRAVRIMQPATRAARLA